MRARLASSSSTIMGRIRTTYSERSNLALFIFISGRWSNGFCFLEHTHRQTLRVGFFFFFLCLFFGSVWLRAVDAVHIFSQPPPLEYNVYIFIRFLDSFLSFVTFINKLLLHGSRSALSFISSYERAALFSFILSFPPSLSLSRSQLLYVYDNIRMCLGKTVTPGFSSQSRPRWKTRNCSLKPSSL